MRAFLHLVFQRPALTLERDGKVRIQEGGHMVTIEGGRELIDRLSQLLLEQELRRDAEASELEARQ